MAMWHIVHRLLPAVLFYWYATRDLILICLKMTCFQVKSKCTYSCAGYFIFCLKPLAWKILYGCIELIGIRELWLTELNILHYYCYINSTSLILSLSLSRYSVLQLKNWHSVSDFFCDVFTSSTGTIDCCLVTCRKKFPAPLMFVFVFVFVYSFIDMKSSSKRSSKCYHN